MATIRTEALTKFYGPVRGVVDLDLEVRAGEVFGFIGPNGAGKTTTIRLLLDLLRPTRGRVEVLGRDPRRDGLALRRDLGYLPGDLALYDDLTAGDHLAWFSHLRGGAGGDRIGPLAERFDLRLDRRIRDLSSGNRRKVGVLQAFVHEPQLVILDEPTSGLDPLLRQELHRLLRETRAEGRTVFLSSHALDEVEAVADRVGIIRDGRLVVVDDVRALRSRAVRRVEILFAAPVPPERFAELPGVSEVEIDGALGRFLVDGSVDALVKAAAGFEVVTLTSREPDLEEIFLAYYSEGPGG
ncbi:MAG TPA: ABC transporter ATP-binding protein [Nitriliruptorales bacterium]|nr:ABC transporter ATP-binding protein [Nitriliruptorales bacterium]